VAVLGQGKVQGVGSMSELSQMDNPDIRQFFDGPRGRAGKAQAAEHGLTQEQRQAKVQAGEET